MTEAKVKFGLSNVHISSRTVGADGTITRGTPVAIPGAVSLSMTRNTAQKVFYADNSPYVTFNTKSNMESDLEMADIAKQIMLDYLGYLKNANGGIMETDTSITATCDISFQLETDVKARRIVLYNNTLSEEDEDYSTTEDEINPVTSKIKVTTAGDTLASGKRVFRTIAEPGDTCYDTFFTTTPEPEEATTTD